MTSWVAVACRFLIVENFEGGDACPLPLSGARRNFAVILDKPSIKIGESEKVLDIFKALSRFYAFQSFHFLVCHFESLAIDCVVKEFDMVLSPLAFVWSDAQPASAKPKIDLWSLCGASVAAGSLPNLLPISGASGRLPECAGAKQLA